MSFIHTFFVTYGLPLISVPVIIHLLNRRRFRRLRWAAMEFLLKAKKQNQRRIRVENLLLLLLRMLLILLILIVVGRPLVSGGALAFLPGSNEAVERILIVDDSASLDQQSAGQSIFERTRTAAVKFCEDLAEKRSSDQVTLIRGSNAQIPELVREPPGSQKMSELLDRMRNWETVDVPVDLVSAVRSVVSGAASESKEGERNLRRVIYMLTDMRRTDWIGSGQSKAKALLEQFRSFEEEGRTAVILVDVSGNEASNIGISNFECLERIAVTEVPLRFKATIKNYDTKPVSDLQLLLKVGNSVVPVQTIDNLGGNASQDVKIVHTFRSEGVFPLTLRVVGGKGSKDVLERDNHRHLSLEVKRAIQVLIVDGEPNAETFEGEVDFLARAIAPPGDTLSGARVKIVREDDILDEDLSAYHLICLANMESWPSERMLALESFVKRGGGLSIFVGDRVDPSLYMRDMWKKGKGLLPCPLGELIGSGDPEKSFRLASPQGKDPLTQVFAGEARFFLRGIRFWRAFDVPNFDPESFEKDGKSRKPSVVMSYDNDRKTPAIVSRIYGRGRVLLFNLTADLEWNNWAKNPSYLIMAQQIWRYLAPSSAAKRNLVAGEGLQRAINPARFETKARLRSPGYPKVPERQLFGQRRDASAIQWFNVPETFKAGVYDLVLKPRPGVDLPAEVHEAYAVNLVPEESDLTRVDFVKLQAALPSVRLQKAELGSKDLYELTEGKRKELWKTALYLFLIFLIVESFLALIAGHHRAVPLDEEEA